MLQYQAGGLAPSLAAAAEVEHPIGELAPALAMAAEVGKLAPVITWAALTSAPL